VHLNIITVTDISWSFYLQDGGKNWHMEQNYATVTLCTGNESVPKIVKRITQQMYFLQLQSAIW